MVHLYRTYDRAAILTSHIALDKQVAEEERPETDDNARTIRPGRSPTGLGTVPLPVAKAPEPQIAPIAEDYSDLFSDEGDEQRLEEKVADFKVCLIERVH